MAKLRFLGAASSVTGSCFLLIPDTGPHLLIDIGMFQGVAETTRLNEEELNLDIAKLGGVIITHAHLDHVGRLPYLVKLGYHGPIYMTEPTQVISEITLLDSAKISREDESKLPLYDEADVIKTMTQIETVNYHQQFQVGQFKINLLDAGHILGSASVEIIDTKTKQKLIFSGDLGNSPEDIVKPTEIPEFADIAVMESTYGDRTHASENANLVLKEEINAIEQNDGVLLIPAFSVERAQELLHKIDHLKQNKEVKDDTMVFLDSPMAIKTTRIYKQFKNLYGDEITKHATNDDPFDFPGLKMVEKHKESLNIDKIQGAKVIIAGSGMMSGGRILHHAIKFLPDGKNRLLLVGFQAEKTLGREINQGARDVKIEGRHVEIHAHIRKSSGMSAHADQPKLLDWVKSIKGIKTVYLIHGENIARQALKPLIQDRAQIDNIILPNLYEEFDLG